MKSGWQTVRLDSVFDIARGGSPRPIDKFITSDPDGLNWVKISDATASGKYIERTREKIKATGLSKTRQVFPGDFLLTNSMSFGRPYIMATDGCIHDGWLVLRPRDETIVWREFFYHLLGSQAVYDRLAGRAAGSTVKNLNTDIVASIEIPLPPLNEQKRIAAILDKADALRAKRRQAIALLDSLTQSIFLEMFGDPVSNPKGWPTFKLSDVAEFFAGNSLPEGLEFKRQVGGYLQLKVSDLNLAENAEHVVIAASFSDKPGSRSGTAPAGAIVFPKRGGAIATNKKRTLARPAILDPNLMGVAPKPQHLNSPFLAAWFKFLNLASISSGSSVPQLNKQDLAPLDISVPPLQLQEVYKARKDQLSENVSHGSASLFASDRLFATLQHRAFTGQL